MKFSGKIGYAVTEETTPGVWVDQIVEKDAMGDYIRNSQRFNNSNQINKSFKLISKSNQFSITSR